MEPRPPPEKLLVCLSSSPHAEKIVHAGRRLADELNAGWVAVYVEVASEPELNPANRARIDEMLRLAESLGATARKIAGHSICEAVFAYARQHNITKMVVGKPLRPHRVLAVDLDHAKVFAPHAGDPNTLLDGGMGLGRSVGDQACVTAALVGLKARGPTVWSRHRGITRTVPSTSEISDLHKPPEVCFNRKSELLPSR